MIMNKATKEAEIIKSLTDLFSEVDRDSIVRILNWANDVYDMDKAKSKGADTQMSLFDLPLFFAEKNPKTDKEKALVVSYWFQFNDGDNNIDALSVNKALQEIDERHKILNITRAYQLLQKNNPPLALQTKKSSTIRQGRKFYKVTPAGKKYVEDM